MSYDLMLLADPGAERARVLQVLSEAADLRRDPQLESRFWLSTAHGEAQVNIGTKDPVESIHLEVGLGSLPLMENVAVRSLELARALDMRVEDVQWGHEVTAENFPQLVEHWKAGGRQPAAVGEGRPWWRFW
jgi:hypothetical protein